MKIYGVSRSGGIRVWAELCSRYFSCEIVSEPEISKIGIVKALIYYYDMLKMIYKSRSLHEVVLVNKEGNIFLFLFLLMFKSKNTFWVIHGFHRDNPDYNILVRNVLSYVAKKIIRVFPSRVIIVAPIDKRELDTSSRLKVNLLYNSIEVRNGLGQPRQRKTIVFLGRINKVKNIEGLVQFARKYELNIDLYGPLEENSGYRELMARTDYLTYKGVLSNGDVHKTLLKYEYLILLSFRESLPLVCLEAVNAGCRLILSDIEAHRLIGFKASWVDLATYECMWVDDSEGEREVNKSYLIENYNLLNWRKSLEFIIKD